MADDQGILGANGAPNLTPVNANAYTFPRSPAQARGHVCTMSACFCDARAPSSLNNSPPLLLLGMKLSAAPCAAFTIHAGID